ncbi:MAG: fibronectin type III domain-containing protein [Candidatus Aquicultorales bacterium]
MSGKWKKLAAVVLTLLIMPVLGQQTAFGWSTPYNASNTSGGDSIEPSVAADAQGNVYIVWTELTGTTIPSFDVFFRAYKQGTGWTSTTNLSSGLTGDSYGPKVAVDGNGKVHAVWLNDTQVENKAYWRSYDPVGNTWNSGQAISGHIGFGTQLDVAAAGGSVMTVWSNAGQTLVSRLYNGTSWGTEQEVPVGHQTAQQPSVSTDAAGNFLVAWEEMYEPDPSGSPNRYRFDVYVSQYGGSSWGAASNISNPTGLTTFVYSRYPEIAGGASGAAFVVWQEGPEAGGAVLKSKVKSGGVWTSVTAPTAGSSWIDYYKITSLARNATSNLYYLVWEADDGIRYATSSGGAWTSYPSFTAAGPMEPAVAAGKAGNMQVVWADGATYLDVFSSDLNNENTTPDTTVPTNPSNLSVSRSGSNLNLTWTASTDAGGNLSGYKVERSANGTSGWSEIGTSATASYIDINPAPNTRHYYQVRAYDSAGNHSGYSTPVVNGIVDTQAPSVPGVPTATAYPGYTTLSWSSSTDPTPGSGLTGYKIERRLGTGAWTQVGTSNTTSYTDAGQVSTGSYTYQVRAYDNQGNNSGYSSPSVAVQAKAGSVNDANRDSRSDTIGFYDLGASNTRAWVFKTVTTTANPTGYTFTPEAWWTSPSGGYALANAKTVTGDFNGDGRADAIALYNGGGSNSTLRFFASNGVNAFAAPTTVFTSAGWNWGSTKLVAGDFNGDGKDELFAFYNYGGTHTGVYVFEQNAQGQFSYRMVFDSQYWDWTKTRILSAKDGAKSKVIAAYNYGGTTTGLWVFELNAQGNLPYPSRAFISHYWDFSRTSFLTGDVEGDGRTDVLAAYNYGGTHTGVFKFKATGLSGEQAYAYPNFIYESTQWYYTSSTFIPGDFNGDGKGDLGAVYDYGANTTGIWLFMSNGTNLAAPQRVYLNSAWNNAATRWVAPYEIVK